MLRYQGSVWSQASNDNIVLSKEMNSINMEFPFEIKDVDKQKNKALLEQFRGELTGFVQIGPKGYFFPQTFKEEAHEIYKMVVRPSDVFVVTYPRSGTTWTSELVWMVANDLDYAKSETITLAERFPYLELKLIHHPETMKKFKKMNEHNEQHLAILESMNQPMTSALQHAPSPRYIRTHLPLTLLPPKLLDTARVVYVARDPRDVAVSYFLLTKLCRCYEFQGNFKAFWKLFMEDLQYWSPYFEHIKEAWEMRHHPQMLFLFYEDMTKDLPAVIKRVAEFVDKEYSDEQVRRLCEHLHISNFRKNKMCNNASLYDIGMFKNDEEPFIRKGKSGGWREHFDEEMQAQAQAWIADNLRGSDFRFPHMEVPSGETS